MTRDEAKRMLPIIQAYEEGKEIETKYEGEWSSDIGEDPCFLKAPEDYRIKPEPKYRPFENDKECWAEMLKHQPFGWVEYDGMKGCISHINHIYILDDGRRPIYFDPRIAEEDGFNMPWALASYTFPDGQPFGVKVEEDE